MDADLQFVLGAFLAVLSLPSLVSAYADHRFPTVGLLMAGLAVVMIWYATRLFPGKYTLESAPEVLFSVLGRFF